jgi:hypothetical protein
MKIHYRMVLLGVCAVGCGGSSGGVDDNELLVDVTPTQAVALCKQLSSDYPQKTVSCGSGVNVTVGDNGSDCASEGSGSNTIPASCTATVGDAENCVAAEYGDPCALASGSDIPQACDAFFACVAGSGS